MVQYLSDTDLAFGAVADPTRRRILERLGRGDTSISELAADCAMTLTGLRKHVKVLEDARLVTTAKAGRVRMCRIGPRRLDLESAWIAKYQELLEGRLNRLEKYLGRTKGEAHD